MIRIENLKVPLESHRFCYRVEQKNPPEKILGVEPSVNPLFFLVSALLKKSSGNPEAFSAKAFLRKKSRKKSGGSGTLRNPFRYTVGVLYEF